MTAEPALATGGLRVTVSGKTYGACLDPSATDLYRDHPEIPVPELRQKGFGYQADFGELSGDALVFLLAHIHAIAGLFTGGGADEDTHREGLAAQRDWERLAAQCEPVQHGYYLDDFGHGWHHDARGWIRVRMLTGKPDDEVRHWVPDGSDYALPWLSIAAYLPLEFVAADHPDETWRKVS
ncbi:hypothetical protein F5X71_34440 [Nocardia brasiliensis]|uniref:Uncharacterized protein n=1 Tax=Nocardia brasiliensis TaxID=37326 RepID=A0A6G9Y0Y3_NOCBR|nr:hypothetical protein [Nocardia brasiliensis]QIS06727.1 hypothetical protein F5X71_34440 [Nocardia brasiliensis]